MNNTTRCRRVKQLGGSGRWWHSSDGATLGKVTLMPRVCVIWLMGYPLMDRRIFKEKYKEFYLMMQEVLINDGMFERNAVNTSADKAKIISHTIAMGNEVFMTMFADMAFLQFLIEAGECQSLDAYLPNDIQYVA